MLRKELLTTLSRKKSERANTTQAMIWAVRKPVKISILSPRKASRKMRDPLVSAAKVRKWTPERKSFF
jgi:hypothetical protein